MNEITHETLTHSEYDTPNCPICRFEASRERARASYEWAEKKQLAPLLRFLWIEQ